MKKFLLTLGVAAMALSSSAATRILYQQNFENVTAASETGWSYGGASMDILSDDYGKFLELNQGNTNGRTAVLTWGSDIFMKDGESVLEDGTYNISFGFSIAQGSNNQYNSEFTIFTNHAPIANNLYRTPWDGGKDNGDGTQNLKSNGMWQTYLFDMSQMASQGYQFSIDAPTAEAEKELSDGTMWKTWSVDTEKGEIYTFNQNEWYRVSLDVDVNNRTVNWALYTEAGWETGEVEKEGVLTVPETGINGEPISMYAEGFYIMVARYWTKYDIDNIVISYESEFETANDPTIALTRLGKGVEDADGNAELNLNLRAYTIEFLDGETLHVVGTDGDDITMEYSDCDNPGKYVYETTTSGTLKAWTTCGDAVSAVIEVEVDCTPCVLPAAVATISAVENGYGKSYILTVDNAEVPLRPTIFINYVFKGESGKVTSVDGVTTGAVVTVDEAGVLTITTDAFGYQSTTIEVKNDSEFETKKVYDFARMDKDALKDAGFATWSVLNSGATSGFNNWTARKRLYYYDKNSATVNEENETVYTAVYPFGFISEENTTNVAEYCDTDGTETGAGYFEGLLVYPGKRVSMLYRIGLYNPDTSGGENKDLIVTGLDEADFVVVNHINDYGSNSNHPICESDAEYYAQLGGENTVYSVATSGVLDEETNLYKVTYSQKRIDVACTKITIFCPAGKSAVEGVEAAEVEGDNWYYSIDGVRMAEPTRPGIYIHNGKKVIVK